MRILAALVLLLMPGMVLASFHGDPLATLTETATGYTVVRPIFSRDTGQKIGETHQDIHEDLIQSQIDELQAKIDDLKAVLKEVDDAKKAKHP